MLRTALAAVIGIAVGVGGTLLVGALDGSPEAAGEGLAPGAAETTGMGRLLSSVAGRRAKWAVVAAWLSAAGARPPARPAGALRGRAGRERRCSCPRAPSRRRRSRPGASRARTGRRIDARLYLGALLLVMVLAVIYRSPGLLALPLAAVGVVELMTGALGLALAKLGVPATDHSSSIVSVLISAPGPTTRCCSWRATARSCAASRIVMRRCVARCAPPARPSSPRR